jgi:hypothetical protein
MQLMVQTLSFEQPPLHSGGHDELPGGVGSGPQGALPPLLVDWPPLPPALLVCPADPVGPGPCAPAPDVALAELAGLGLNVVVSSPQANQDAAISAAIAQ